MIRPPQNPYIRPLDRIFDMRPAQILAFLIAVSALMGCAYAQSEAIEATFLPQKVAVHPEIPTEFTVSVENLGEAMATVNVGAFGDQLGWITLPKNEELDSGEKEIFKVIIRPPKDVAPGIYQFQLTADVLDIDGNAKLDLRWESNIELTVLERFDTRISILKTAKDSYYPLEPITFTSTVANGGTAVANKLMLAVEMTDAEGRVEYFEESIEDIESGQEFVITKDIEPEKYKSEGEYKISGTLYRGNNKVSIEESAFTILPADSAAKHDVRTTTGFLSRTYNVVLTNRGFESMDIEHKMDVPKIRQLYSFSRPPEEVGGKLVWGCTLEPEQSCSFMYTVSYWKPALALIMLLALLRLGKEELKKPLIGKRHTKHGAGHIVHVEVRNRGKEDLKDVMVEDLVPNVFEMTGYYSVKPKIVKTQGGKRLTWRVGALKSKEERVFSYGIKPRLEVPQGMDLPGAKVNAKTKKKTYAKTSGKIRV